jgi:two-component system KDP operon response regulator KdpE
MEAQEGITGQGPPRARLLLLYGVSHQAAGLVERLSPKHYEVISCPVSAASESWLSELQADLVLLLPPSDQKQLLEACSAVRERTDAPVVVLSERDDELLITRALATGVDEYLVLPMGDRELAARIEALLRRLQRQAGLGDTRQVGELTLSTADHSVERNGRRIFLSPIEFRVLACLASSPGKVLTHQTLMSRVWGAEYVDSRHYLRLYIRYLREKLEDDPTSPQLIVSEWGVGYRLQLPEQQAAAAERGPRPRRAARPAPSLGLA